MSDAAARPRLPRAIWALGFTSLLMDTSSEFVHALLPLFLTGSLGASTSVVGLIEGVAEATAQVTKVFSGWLSDRLGHRKWLAVAGYGLAALSKPLFPLAHSVGTVFAARFMDRIGKGIRGAPRDALVADVCTPAQRGAAYGLRQAMDSIGAVLGPLAAIVLVGAFSAELSRVLWFAVVPALLAVLVLATGVDESARSAQRSDGAPPLRFADAAALPARFWAIVAAGTVFTLARFSEAFIVLRAADVGIATPWVPGVMIAMNVVYAASAYPAGAAADRIGARRLLAAGLLVLLGADLLFACWPTAAGALAGAALWGLHLGLTQGLFAKLVADSAPAAARGTAFGLFNLATGVALLGASVLAGMLWHGIGARAPFLAGAAFAALAALAVTLRRPSAQPAR